MMTRHENAESDRRRSNIAQAIDKMCESDQQLARDYLRTGELVGELIGRACGNLRSVVTLVSGSFKRASRWNERVERS